MAVARIGGRAVADYMQDGPRPRKPGEKGPLIKQSQDLMRAVLGGAGSKFDLQVRRNVTKLMWQIFIPYAAIHEYGGKINLTITAQMRSFFWAMWYDTKDDKWKAMALTKKTSFQITMPKRAYIEPSIKLELTFVQQKAAEIMFTFIDSILAN